MIELTKWQPVVVVTNKRLECECGALAVFVTGIQGDEHNVMEEVGVYCQPCFQRMQEEEEE